MNFIRDASIKELIFLLLGQGFHERSVGQYYWWRILSQGQRLQLPYYIINGMQLLQTNRTRRQTQEKSALERELERAKEEIIVLKAENNRLTGKVAELELRQELVRLAEEQLACRQQVQNTLAALLANSQDFNTRLQEKLRSLQNDPLTPKELATTLETTGRNLEQCDFEIPSTKRFRLSSMRARAQSVDHKENHQITPKSRVNIDLSRIFDEKQPTRKRVFI